MNRSLRSFADDSGSLQGPVLLCFSIRSGSNYVEIRVSGVEHSHQSL